MRKTDNPIKKQAKYLDRNFIKEAIHVANKHTERSST